MTDVELLASWLDDLSRGVHRALDKMSPAQLAWQPDSEANSIGVTVWHMARWLDALATLALANCDAREQVWFGRGWAEKTKYDPRGIGSLGLGAVTGYSLQEVKAIPALAADQLLEYFDQALQTLKPKILALTPSDFAQPATALGEKEPRAIYYWIRAITQGCFAHIGEIQALKAMYDRAYRTEAVRP